MVVNCENIKMHTPPRLKRSHERIKKLSLNFSFFSLSGVFALYSLFCCFLSPGVALESLINALRSDVHLAVFKDVLLHITKKKNNKMQSAQNFNKKQPCLP